MKRIHRRFVLDHIWIYSEHELDIDTATSPAQPEEILSHPSARNARYTNRCSCAPMLKRYLIHQPSRAIHHLQPHVALPRFSQNIVKLSCSVLFMIVRCNYTRHSNRIPPLRSISHPPSKPDRKRPPALLSGWFLCEKPSLVHGRR